MTKRKLKSGQKAPRTTPVGAPAPPVPPAPPGLVRASTMSAVDDDYPLHQSVVHKFDRQINRYARNAVILVFEHMGGWKGLAEVAADNPKWYYEKMFSKLVSVENNVTAEAEDDVEDLLIKLDRSVIDAKAVNVPVPPEPRSVELNDDYAHGDAPFVDGAYGYEENEDDEIG